MDGCSGWQIKGDRETSHSATIIKVAEFSFACGISLKEVAIVKNLSRLRGLADSGMAHEITMPAAFVSGTREICHLQYSVLVYDD
jgi:hypothetical protein